jgi:hypothetical protein
MMQQSGHPAQYAQQVHQSNFLAQQNMYQAQQQQVMGMAHQPHLQMQ